MRTHTVNVTHEQAHHARLPPRLRGVEKPQDLQRGQHVQPPPAATVLRLERAVGGVLRLELVAEGGHRLAEALAVEPLLVAEPGAEFLPVRLGSMVRCMMCDLPI